MEDSEKRRERLKAMRSIAAAQAETSNNVETSAPPGLLAYPLLETPTTLLAQGESSAIARFDFDTDPSVTFSANRKSVVGNPAARSYFTFPSNNSSVPQLSSPHLGYCFSRFFVQTTMETIRVEFLLIGMLTNKRIMVMLLVVIFSLLECEEGFDYLSNF